MPRAELKMQSRIVESYAAHGGYAAKWKDEYTKGKPDLVCSLPGVGVHLLEVKHRPEWDLDRVSGVNNPMEERQVIEARRYMRAGGLILACLVVGGAKTVSDAQLAFFDPLSKVWYLHDAVWAPWHPQNKFDVLRALKEWRKKNA